MAIDYNAYSGKGRPKKTDYVVDGVDQANAKLKATEMNIQANLELILVSAGLEIANTAQDIITENGHIITGTLKGSIMSFVTVDQASKETYASIGSFPPGSKGFNGSDAPYAPYVEALPDGGFLRPAYNQKKKEVEGLIANAIKKVIDSARAGLI